MGEPGGLPSEGSHRVGHDWSNLAAAAARPPGDTLRIDNYLKCLVCDSSEDDIFSPL